MKEFLEYNILEHLEPDGWDFNNDGLYLGWCKPQKLEKNCIDKAIRKVEAMFEIDEDLKLLPLFASIDK